MLTKYACLLGSLYKCLSSLLSIAFPLKASEQGHSSHQVLLPLRSTYGPVMQENLSGSHCVGDEISSSAVFASVNRYARFPVIASHAHQRGAGRRVA